MILLTDTHLGLYKSSDVWHNVVLDLFKEVYSFSVDNGISTIIHLGDFFHERKSINSKTLSVAREIEDILFPFKMYIITGNHDIYYKNSLRPSSLQVFKNSPNIIVVDEPYTLDDILMVPWAQEIPESNALYCLGHFDINGSLMNNKKACDNGKYNVDMFKQFKSVYSGHFHTPSVNGNITYLGSPFQQTFADTGNKHGYYKLSFDGELEFIEFTQYPKFTIIHSDDIMDESVIKGNSIKLIFRENVGTNQTIEIVEHIQSLNPLTLNVDFSAFKSSEDVEYESDKISSHFEIMEEWMNNDKKVAKNIDRKVIKNMINEMMEEV